MRPDIDDEAVAALAGLVNLETLGLSSAAMLTDAAARILPGLPKLTWLDLSGCTGLTAKGIETLKTALPECRITGPRDLAFVPNTPAKVQPR